MRGKLLNFAPPPSLRLSWPYMVMRHEEERVAYVGSQSKTVHVHAQACASHVHVHACTSGRISIGVSPGELPVATFRNLFKDPTRH